MIENILMAVVMMMVFGSMGYGVYMLDKIYSKKSNTI